MRIHDKVQCAGQGCHERSQCARYVKRGGHDWASFDVERALRDSCFSKIEFAGPAIGPRRAGKPRNSERTYQGVHP